MSERDDRILEDLLRRRREGGTPLGGPLCGDPELLAAFAEDALAGKPREEMEVHLAACAACRETVARLVRLAPREGTPAAATPVPAAFWKRWIWAAPALAGIVLVGSFVMYNREKIVEPSAPPKMPEVALSPAAPKEPSNERTIESRRSATAKPPAPQSSFGVTKEAVAGGTGVVASGAPAAAPAPAISDGKFAPQPPQKPDALAALQENKVADQVKSETQERQQVQVQVMKQQPAPSQQAVAQSAPAPPAQLKSRDDAAQQNAENAPTTAKTAAPMLRSGAALGGAPASESRAKGTAGAVGGGAGVGGVAAVFDARSDKDNKKKVAALHMPGGKVMRVARFKDSDQAWALLSDGRVLVTQDAGENWKGVILPERAASVAAPDAGVGEFTGVSGRVYRSTDGGASWKVTSLR